MDGSSGASSILHSGSAWKLSSKPGLFSVPWTSRFFVVELRHTKAGAQHFFSYYPSQARSVSVNEARDAVPVTDITSVSMMTPAKVAIYVGALSSLAPALQRELYNHRELAFEVQTPGRTFFLRCQDRIEAARLAGGLQRLAALPPDIAWPVNEGPEPCAPASVIAARKAAGTLAPGLDSILAAAAARVGARPPDLQPVQEPPVKFAPRSAADSPALGATPSGTASAAELSLADAKLRGVDAALVSRPSSARTVELLSPRAGVSSPPSSPLAAPSTNPSATGPSWNKGGKAPAAGRKENVIDLVKEEAVYDQRLRPASSPSRQPAVAERALPTLAPVLMPVVADMRSFAHAPSAQSLLEGALARAARSSPPLEVLSRGEEGGSGREGGGVKMRRPGLNPSHTELPLSEAEEGVEDRRSLKIAARGSALDDSDDDVAVDYSALARARVGSATDSKQGEASAAPAPIAAARMPLDPPPSLDDANLVHSWIGRGQREGFSVSEGAEAGDEAEGKAEERPSTGQSGAATDSKGGEASAVGPPRHAGPPAAAVVPLKWDDWDVRSDGARGPSARPTSAGGAFAPLERPSSTASVGRAPIPAVGLGVIADADFVTSSWD